MWVCSGLSRRRVRSGVTISIPVDEVDVGDAARDRAARASRRRSRAPRGRRAPGIAARARRDRRRRASSASSSASRSAAASASRDDLGGRAAPRARRAGRAAPARSTPSGSAQRDPDPDDGERPLAARHLDEDAADLVLVDPEVVRPLDPAVGARRPLGSRRAAATPAAPASERSLARRAAASTTAERNSPLPGVEIHAAPRAAAARGLAVGDHDAARLRAARRRAACATSFVEDTIPRTCTSRNRRALRLAAMRDARSGESGAAAVTGRASGTRSSARSSARAECVSAPTEIRSMPAPRDRGDVLERDAAARLEQRRALRARPGSSPPPRAASARHVVEEHDVRFRLERRLELLERLDLDLDDDRPGRAAARVLAIASRTASGLRGGPQKSRWFSLIRTWSESPARWLKPPPIERPRTCRARGSPGTVLRVSRIRALVPAHAAT